jgi:integration host factor subunit alpha
MTLRKAEIIKSIQNQLDLPQDKSTEIFESFLEIIKASLENCEDVMISGFGEFCVNKKNERRGRNPKTGENITLAPRKVLAAV